MAISSLPYSTTFDCPEWTQSDGLTVGAVNCDGLAGWLDVTCGAGEEDTITTAANHSAGDGGRGFRHLEGDGVNDNGSGLFADFDADHPEIYVRWYMRYQSGFAWTGGQPDDDKWLYFRAPGTDAKAYCGWIFDRVRIVVDGTPFRSATGNGWATTMGGATSDGLWHLYEVHLKWDTDGTDGIGQIWIDETLRLNVSNINYGSDSTGVSAMIIGSNQKDPNNGQCEAVDFDDMAMAVTGPIGPLAEEESPIRVLGFIA